MDSYKWWAGAVSVPLMALVFTSCGLASPSFESVVQDGEAGAPARVVLSEVFPEESFSRALVVCPYTSESDVVEALGFSWEGVKGLPLERDDKQVLLLVEGSSLERVEILGRTVVDFCGKSVPVREVPVGEELVFSEGSPREFLPEVLR